MPWVGHCHCVYLVCSSAMVLSFPGSTTDGEGLLGASRCPVVAELVSADFSQAPREALPYFSLESFLLLI